METIQNMRRFYGVLLLILEVTALLRHHFDILMWAIVLLFMTQNALTAALASELLKRRR